MPLLEAKLKDKMMKRPGKKNGLNFMIAKENSITTFQNVLQQFVKCTKK